MTRTLRLYVTTLVVIGAIALPAAGVLLSSVAKWNLGLAPDISIDPNNHGQADLILGVAFWVVVALFASALPVRMPRGSLVSVSIAPIVAATVLGGPFAGGVVAAIGTTEVRELRGRIPWYGTLFNHAGLVIPAILGGFVMELSGVRGPDLFLRQDVLRAVFATMLGAMVLFGTNALITSIGVGLRFDMPVRMVLLGDVRAYLANLFALAPLAWLMSKIYTADGAGWWATLLFALPLYTTRVAHHRYVEMRDMFTQTIGALAEAVDKRDPFTSKHSQRVKDIAGDIGREMRLSESELEALEWGGLLHDVGKIGVPDAVLLKQERLNREERMIMNAHPVLGAQIIAPVTKLAPELPIIRHHHEWYNGSGYPDRLIGDEIPKLARILHVADAFEAMTAQRPYRMTPLTAEQAVAELRKFAGIQFDPQVVDAFVRTHWVDGVIDPGRTVQPRPIPLIAQAANRITQATAPEANPAQPN
jgi:putative nucleotidyltransferase with HDIG domain